MDRQQEKERLTEPPLPRNGTGPSSLVPGLTPEQRQQLRAEMLVQAAAKVENARVNLLMAQAAYAALAADGG